MLKARACRPLAVACLTASLSLLPLVAAQAAPRERHQARGRETSPRVEPRPVLDQFWTTLVRLWEKVGLVIDGNG